MLDHQISMCYSWWVIQSNIYLFNPKQHPVILLVMAKHDMSISKGNVVILDLNVSLQYLDSIEKKRVFWSDCWKCTS